MAGRHAEAQGATCGVSARRHFAYPHRRGFCRCRPTLRLAPQKDAAGYCCPVKVPGSSVSPTRRCLLSWSLGCVLPPADPLLPGSVHRDSPRRTRAPVALLRAGSAFLIPALSPSPGQKRRLDGAKPADRHRVRAALRAFGQRRSRVDLRPAAATGLGPAEVRRLAAGAHRRQAAPPQAGRRRQQPHRHPQRAERQIRHGEGCCDGT